jgi:hypothetical protein
MQKTIQTPHPEVPDDMRMYWMPLDNGTYWDAPIWEFCDEDEAPETMSFVDEDGLVLL